MAQYQKSWIEVEEFSELSAKIVEKYPERFSEIDLDKIIAYCCTNKERPDSDSKPFRIGGTTPPESFTNSKTYFITMYQNVWEQTLEQKILLVFSALERIDPNDPGKVKPLDYADQEVMVSTFGAHWHNRGDLPNLLTKEVNLR